MKFTIPDSQFPLTVASWRDARGRTIGHVFSSTLEARPPHLCDWQKVPGVTVLLIGDCADALKSLLLKYRNEELVELIGLDRAKSAAIARHLRISRHRPDARGGSRGKWQTE